MQDQILFKKRWTEIIDRYLSSETYKDIVLYSLGLADELDASNPVVGVIKLEIDEYMSRCSELNAKRRLAGMKHKGNQYTPKKRIGTNGTSVPNGTNGTNGTSVPNGTNGTNGTSVPNVPTFEKDNFQFTDNEEDTHDIKVFGVEKTQKNSDFQITKRQENKEQEISPLSSPLIEKENKEKKKEKEVLTYQEKNENQNSDENEILFQEDENNNHINSEKKEIVVDAPPSSAAPPAQLQLDAFAYMDDRPQTPTRYELFCKKVEEHAPWCYKNLKILTEREMYRLLDNYSPQQIIETICEIENRKDLRKRYVSLYRTLLNWLKNNYGKQGTDTRR